MPRISSRDLLKKRKALIRQKKRERGGHSALLQWREKARHRRRTLCVKGRGRGRDTGRTPTLSQTQFRIHFREKKDVLRKEKGRRRRKSFCPQKFKR